MWKRNRNKTCIYNARSFIATDCDIVVIGASIKEKRTLWVKQDTKTNILTTNIRYDEDSLYPLNTPDMFQFETREQCDKWFRDYVCEMSTTLECAENNGIAKIIKKESRLIYEK